MSPTEAALRAENARLRAELARIEQAKPSPYELLNNQRWAEDRARAERQQQEMKLARGGWPLRV